MRIGMIWAEARGGVIGRDGDMPWHVPEDLAHFKHTTAGSAVMMGRRTWQSLPERFRPLPGRVNIVVSRDPEFETPGANRVASLDEAIGAARAQESAAMDETAWVMGGGQLYRAAMPIASTLVVTRLDLEVAGGDTFAPDIGPEWQLVDPGESRVSASGTGYRFERWERR